MRPPRVRRWGLGARPLRALLAAVVGATAAAFLAGASGGGVPAVLAADPVALEVQRVAPPPDPVRPRVIWNGPRSGRVVALTFDDGWSPRTLRQIYRILVREEVPATFFVTGAYVQRAPSLWRAIAEAGFPLANHSYLHRDTRTLAPAEIARDLTRTRRTVEKATGRAMLPYFRPPYGFRTPATDRLAAAAGFPYIVMWDTVGGDTAGRPAVARVVAGAAAGRSGSIVLLHAGPQVTPRALPAIIAAYRARGFEFVTLPDLLAGRRSVAPAVPSSPPAIEPSRGGPAPDRSSRGPSRRLDRVADDMVAPGPLAAPPAPVATPAATPLPPQAPSNTVDERRPRARDAAWARSDDALPGVAGFSLALLVALLVLAAIAGRGGTPGDDRVL